MTLTNAVAGIWASSFQLMHYRSFKAMWTINDLKANIKKSKFKVAKHIFITRKGPKVAMKYKPNRSSFKFGPIVFGFILPLNCFRID